MSSQSTLWYLPPLAATTRGDSAATGNSSVLLAVPCNSSGSAKPPPLNVPRRRLALPRHLVVRSRSASLEATESSRVDRQASPGSVKNPSGSSVALTLLRTPDSTSQRVPFSETTVKLSQRRSGTDPTAAQLEEQASREKLSQLKQQLAQAKVDEEKCRTEYAKTKTHKNKDRVTEARKAVEALQQQLVAASNQQATTTVESSHGGRGSTSNLEAVQDRRFSQTSFEAAGSAANPNFSSYPTTVLSTSPTSPMSPISMLSGMTAEATGSVRTDASKEESSAPVQSDNGNTDAQLFSSKDSSSANRQSASILDHSISETSGEDIVDSCALLFSSPASIASSGTVEDKSEDHPEEASDLSHIPSFVANSRPRSQANIISMEDDDFPGETENATRDHGPYVDLEILKKRHAHCAIFLAYLNSNGNPSALLFHLVTDVYMQGNLKDMKKWAYEIHSTFLVKDAPLHVSVNDAIVHTIDGVLERRVDKEDVMRSIFMGARLDCQPRIAEDLADFRNKLDLGLANMFSDGELYGNEMDRGNELRTVERQLKDMYDQYKNDTSPKGECMSYSLVALMRDWGVPKVALGGGGGSSGNSAGVLGSGSGLERAPSLLMKDKSKLKDILYNKVNRVKKETVRNHVFASQMYQSTTYCDICTLVMWGIGYQGLQCQACEMNVHKDCLHSVEMCQKKRRQRMSPFLDSSKKKSTTSAGLAHSVLSVQASAGIAIGGTYESVESISPNPAQSTVKVEPEIATLPDLFPGSRSVNSLVEQFESQAVQTPLLPPATSASADAIDATQSSGGSSSQVSLSSVASSAATASAGMSPSTTLNANVGRSESFTDKTMTSDAGTGLRSKDTRRSRSDVDRDEEAVLRSLTGDGSSGTALQPHHSSSSASSLASAKSDSGASENSAADFSKNSAGTVSRAIPSVRGDSDLEVEVEMPSIDSLIPKEQLRKLKPKERKRQEIINELFYTERSHVRNLKILDQLFRVPMESEGVAPELVKLLFSNISDVVKVHCSLNDAMKRRQKESALVLRIGDVLVDKFDGAAGEKMKEVCAEYCKDHKVAGETLKSRRRRDSKLQEMIHNGESSPHCRRLQLHDLLIAEVHRLTKYPLLIDSLLKYTPDTADAEECKNLQSALRLSESILTHVNNTVKTWEDRQTLASLQKRLDVSLIDKSSNPAITDYRNLDFTKHLLVYSGALSWRIPGRSKPISLHVVLLTDLLVLLQTQDDGRLVLKYQSALSASGKEDTKSPVLHLSGMLTRPVATDKKAFFVIDTVQHSGQMYELIASSVEERKRWVNYITEAVERLKVPHSATPATARPQWHGVRQAADGVSSGAVVVNDAIAEEELALAATQTSISEELASTKETKPVVVPSCDEPTSASSSAADFSPCDVPSGDSPMEDTLDSPQAIAAMSYAQLLQEKDDVIMQAMADKKRIVCDALHVPEVELDSTARVIAVTEGDRDPQSLVLALMSEAMCLTTLLSAMPNDSSNEMNAVTANLNRQLNVLLDVILRKEAERERIQQQLASQRQGVHSLRGVPVSVPLLSLANDAGDDSRPVSFISISSELVSGDESYVQPADKELYQTAQSQVSANSSSAAEESEELDDDATPPEEHVVETDDYEATSAGLTGGQGTEETCLSEPETRSEVDGGEMDSDDEGTVYADAVDGDGTGSLKLGIPTADETAQRPSSRCDVSVESALITNAAMVPAVDTRTVFAVANSDAGAVTSVGGEGRDAMTGSSTSDSLEFNDAQATIECTERKSEAAGTTDLSVARGGGKCMAYDVETDAAVASSEANSAVGDEEQERVVPPMLESVGTGCALTSELSEQDVVCAVARVSDHVVDSAAQHLDSITLRDLEATAPQDLDSTKSQDHDSTSAQDPALCYVASLVVEAATSAAFECLASKSTSDGNASGDDTDGSTTDSLD